MGGPASIVLLALAAAPAVNVSAEPPFVVHGETARLVVTTALPGAQLSLDANVGTVSEPKRDGAGRWVATYSSPKERYPQVALVVARVQSNGRTEFGWLAIPVHGRDTLKLTTKPGATTTVTVSRVTFGPRMADQRGKVEMPVEVPPGVQTGTVASVDRLGNKKVRPVDLEPPPFTRLHLVAAGDSASWADLEPLPLEVFAVRPDGTPLENAASAIRLESSDGALGPLTPAGGGVYRTSWRPPDSVGDGKAQIRARLDSGGESTLTVALRPGPPARVTLSADRAFFVVAGSGPVALEAAAFDARGNAVPGGVRVEVDFGRLEGRSWQLPAWLSGRTSATATARAGESATTLALALSPGPPRSGELALSRPSVRAGDAGTVAIVTVRDEFGNPISDARLEPAATAGRTSNARALGGGRYEISWSADTVGEHRLTVRAGELVLEAPVVVLPGLDGWGVSAGLYGAGQTNFRDVHAFSPAAELSLRLPHLELELLFRAGRPSFAAVELSPPGTLSLWGLMALAGARYAYPITLRGAVHASLGAGLLGLGARKRFESGVEQSPPMQWGPVGQAAVGYGHRLGPGRLMGELHGTIAPLAAAGAQGRVQGSASGVGASVGYLVELR